MAALVREREHYGYSSQNVPRTRDIELIRNLSAYLKAEHNEFCKVFGGLVGKEHKDFV